MGVQNRSQEAPRGNRKRHRRSQGPPKSSQKEPERAPKRLQNHFWIEQRRFLKNDNIVKIKSSFPRVGGSVWELKIGPKRFREEIKNDIELPKGARESPQTLSKPSLDRKRRFLKHTWIPNIKPTCLKVGGSVWELKIDPKRLRKGIKNDTERRR